MRRTRFLIWKEMIELRRDPRLLFIVIVAPILQLFLLAYAATTDVREVPVLIVDADRSSASRDVVARFAASPSFAIAGVVSSPDEIDRLPRRRPRLVGGHDSARLRRRPAQRARRRQSRSSPTAATRTPRGSRSATRATCWRSTASASWRGRVRPARGR